MGGSATQEPDEGGHGLPQLIAERRAKGERLRESDPERVPLLLPRRRADLLDPRGLLASEGRRGDR